MTPGVPLGPAPPLKAGSWAPGLHSHTRATNANFIPAGPDRRLQGQVCDLWARHTGPRQSLGSTATRLDPQGQSSYHHKLQIPGLDLKPPSSVCNTRPVQTPDPKVKSGTSRDGTGSPRKGLGPAGPHSDP